MEIVYPESGGGYFIEIGAADGVAGSSCFLLEKDRFWTGVCVEPDTRFFDHLLTNRPGSVCCNICVSDASGIAEFVQAENPYLSGIRDNLERFKQQGVEISRAGQCSPRECTTLAGLLDAQGAPAVIDYAALDIEGSELEVLRPFPFDRYVFRALSLECDGRIWEGITELLQLNNYHEVENPFNIDKPWERYWLHETMACVS